MISIVESYLLLIPINLSHDYAYIQGPESSLEEVACQSSKGSIITTGELYYRLMVIKSIQYMTTYMIQYSSRLSGGGFSHYTSRPSWQDTAVEQYFESVTGTEKTPLYPRFNNILSSYTDRIHTITDNKNMTQKLQLEEEGLSRRVRTSQQLHHRR